MREAQQTAPDSQARVRGGCMEASGDDRLSRRSTIIGPTGLTAVFGMGTGGTPPVWSPERRPAGGQAAPGAFHGGMVTHGPMGMRRGRGLRPRVRTLRSRGGIVPDFGRGRPIPRPPGGGERIGVVKHSAVRTGRLRRLPAVHARPIDLVVFQEPSHLRAGNLVLEGASRLDAFSAYPVPTWLPGDAPSGTAGTPAVGPPQSSRTRGDAPQVSSAHGR